MELKTITLKEANAYIDKNHRHHKKVCGHKFSLACYKNGLLCGVAIVGRPVSRYLDDGATLEVTRLCTNGTKNVCSFLYSHAARAGLALGYSKMITYILESESGVSLKAAGWVDKGRAGGKYWTGKRRRYSLDEQPYPAEMKHRYEKILIQRKKTR